MKDSRLETRFFCAKPECAEVEYPVDLIKKRNLQVFYAYPNVTLMSENLYWST